MASRAHTHVKNLQPLVVNPNPTYTPPFGGPSTPTITSPANGTTSQGGGVILSGYAHTSGVPQSAIQVQRATNIQFTENSVLFPMVATTTNTAAVSATGIVAGTVYYFRARYIDTFGQPSEWSPASSFTAVTNPTVTGQARSGSTGAQTHSLTFTGAAIGDLIILAIAANTLPTTPSGFTAQSSYSSVLSGSAVYMYSKVATANNESVSVTVAGACDVQGVSLRYATAYPGSTYLAQGKTATTGLTINIPSVGAGRWSLVMGFCRSPSNFTMPSGWTTIYNLTTQSGSGYFTPLLAWTNALAAGTITRGSATYEAWQITLSF